MLLSNRCKSFLFAFFFVTFFQACGSSPSGEDRPISLNGGTKSEFPFSTREPVIYQGDFVVTSGGIESRWFMARKLDKWRSDRYRGAERWLTELKSDRFYLIDHRARVFAAEPGATGAGVATGPASGFFSGKEYREFEELGREGNLIKYKVRQDAASRSDILIHIDALSGMMVRQEFALPGENTAYIYEIRNLNLEVDDSVFSIPDGYRMVTYDEFRKTAQLK